MGRKVRFCPWPGNGKGNLPAMQYCSDEHSNSFDPFLRQGLQGVSFSGVLQMSATAFAGHLFRNTEIAQLIKMLWLK